MFSVKEIGIAMVTAVALTLILGPIMIPMLRKMKFGQTVRDDGPQSHLQKNGTPTMGGLIMMMGILGAVVLSNKFDSGTLISLISIFGFGLIGFIDDYIKVVLKRSLGLRAYQKIIGQFGLALGIAIYQQSTSPMGTKMIVPFINDFYLDLGILYIPFLMIVIIGTVNSVNLTDGLDGLASGITFIVSSFFTIYATIQGYTGLAIVMASVMGACLGFLKFNKYPAQIFMGDTGSMALGGAVAAAAVIMNISLVIPIVGGIYFAESLSVIIQVASFKFRGKRVFRMSPIHHHFELGGWKETKVVKVFWTTTLILSVIGFFSLI